MKYYFPLHLNGNNRGCEAIAKGTAILLNEPKENLIGLCNDIATDHSLGISNYVTLVGTKEMTCKRLILRKLHRLVVPQRDKHMKFVYGQVYDSFLNSIPDDGIVVSTGGDMYCYQNNEAVYTTKKCQDRGLRTILWGCSIGQNNLTPEKLENLKNFGLIYVRESLSEAVLYENGIEKVINFPDPAFVLNPQQCVLPDCFNRIDIIGLNISNFIMYRNSSAREMVFRFVEDVLSRTEYDILLIPHVLWNNQNDSVVSNQLLRYFKNSTRVHILETKNYNYCEIRYIISKCRFFIGARTHSVISAYSTCVPSIALGYSIKSRGIANDLRIPEELVIDCVQDVTGQSLINSFNFLEENEKEIRVGLLDEMPNYISRLNKLKLEVVRALQ